MTGRSISREIVLAEGLLTSVFCVHILHCLLTGVTV